MHEALCRSSGTTLDSVHAEDGPPITQRTSGLGKLDRAAPAFRSLRLCDQFFLPYYSPDLNTIEQVLAKLKTLLRKADERTVEATWKPIGTLLDHFPPRECANYLVNAGYASA